MGKITVIGPRDRYKGEYIDTTSKLGNWSAGLSPFYLKDIPLYDGTLAANMENAWQFSKVYPQHVGAASEPLPEYFTWARAGWDNPLAVRFPMGKGAKPVYTLWDGKQLGRIEARQQVFIPLYAAAVVKTPAFKKLKESVQQNDETVLWDYDGYNFSKLGMSFKDVITDTTREMGHAFVLAMLLEGYVRVENDQVLIGA